MVHPRTATATDKFAPPRLTRICANHAITATEATTNVTLLRMRGANSGHPQSGTLPAAGADLAPQQNQLQLVLPRPSHPATHTSLSLPLPS